MRTRYFSRVREKCDGFRCSGRAKATTMLLFARKEVYLCDLDARDCSRILRQDIGRERA